MMPTGKRARVESSDELELELELELESNNGGGDRISGLCNEILHHIFSFLPTRGVVQTCVLSKRWRNLWCSVPWLDFDEEEEDAVLASSSSNNSSKLQRAGSFSTFVNYVMLLRDGSNIQKLRLSCCSNNNTSNHVFDCVISAVRHNLQVLDLKILQNHHQSEPAEKVLPPSLFTCKSLTCLNLNNIVLPSYSSIHLSSLKTLHLISVKFPSLSTEALFSNSPNLETLTMQNCNFEHLKNFLISAKQLKNLIIIQDEASSSTSSKISITRIFAPNLISLKLHVDLHPGWYFLENLNSLVEANIHIKKPLCKYISLSFMIGIFCELRNAKAITLSGSCLQVIGKELISSSVETINARLHILRLRFMKSIETPFHNLKLLNLKTRFENGEVHAITDLLKRSPNIETLAIEYNSESSYEENELPLREEKLPSECTLHHLKTIQMHGFGGRKNELKLLTFLLENAKSLKKMIVEEASV